MRIFVDRDLCQGHGVCCEEAPEAFRLNQGELELLQQEPPEALRDKLKLAVKYCPTGALRLED